MIEFIVKGVIIPMGNYFTSSIKHYGREDFVVLLKPEEIQRSAKDRIFREMVRGRIDYVQFGQYFLDSKFLSNLIVAADNELTNNVVISQALEFYDLNFPGHLEVIHNKTRHENLVVIYRVILERLRQLEVSGNVGVLTDIQYVLNGIKQYI